MFEHEPSGSLKYSPPISDEKRIEGSTAAFMQLCRTEEGRELAITIINNHMNNE